MNGSDIWRRALETKTVTYERLREAMSEIDVMKRLIQTLKAPKEEEIEWSHNIGREHGQQRTLKEAGFGYLVNLQACRLVLIS